MLGGNGVRLKGVTRGNWHSVPEKQSGTRTRTRSARDKEHNTMAGLTLIVSPSLTRNLLCALCVVAAPLTVRATPAWEPAGPLNTNAGADSGFDYHPSLAGGPNGTWVCVWQTNQPLPGSAGTAFHDIAVARSTDGGASWTPPSKIGPPGIAEARDEWLPGVATDGNGAYLAVWSDFSATSSTPGAWFSYSIDDGVEWTAPAPVAAPIAGVAARHRFPRVAMSPTGTWMIGWTTTYTGSSSSWMQYIRSTDRGTTWSAPTPLIPPTVVPTGLHGPTYLMDIKCDGAGRWLAVIMDNFADIWVSSSIPDVPGFGIPKRISFDGGFGTMQNASGASAAMATGGAWVVAWQSRTFSGGDFDLVFSRSTDAGLTWSWPQALNLDAAADPVSEWDIMPFLATDSHGLWTAVWEHESQNNPDVTGPGDWTKARCAWSTDDGATWSAPEPVIASDPVAGGLQIHPTVATDALGRWVAAWYSYFIPGAPWGGDSDIFRTMADTPVPPPPGADLRLTKELLPSPAVIGAPIPFEIAGVNLGPGTARNVIMVDQLPGNAALDQASVTSGTFAVAGGKLTADFGDLPPGVTVKAFVSVKPDFTGPVTNHAYAASDTPDPDAANNADEVTVPVGPHADLAVRKLAPPTAPVDRPLTFTLEVGNSGPAPATGVVVSDPLPAGMNLLDVVGAAATTVTGNLVLAYLGPLAPGTTATVRIVVLPTIAGEAANTASVGGNAYDPVPANNTDTATVVISSPPPAHGPDLTGNWVGVTARERVQRNSVRSQIKATFTVRNIGDATAGNSRLRCFISDDAVLDADDTPVGAQSVGSLKAGQSKQRTVTANLAGDQSSRFLIASVDAEGQVAETNEMNNVIVHGPFP
jgi:uncharacterized repeat protein (TIGR01451 family)